MTGTSFSYTFFSTMPSGTQIAPHNGPCNIKLRCHFPIFVPKLKPDTSKKDSKDSVPPMYLRIADKITTWEEGKMIIFDDTYEHEAGNMVSDDQIELKNNKNG